MGAAAALGLAVAALHLRDPHQRGSWGLCPFKALTGWDCPGCGGLRAVNDLSNGELSSAWHSNALVVSLVPVAVLLWLGWVVVATTGRRPRLSLAVRRVPLVLLPAAAIAFAVFRNTPWGNAFYVS